MKNKAQKKRPVQKTMKELVQFTRAQLNPLKVQQEILFEILRRNKNTYYGKKYRFSKIDSIREFQRRVPIIKYDDILPLIKKIHEGKQGLLTKDKVVFLGTTSGSSGAPKMIPVTKKRKASFRKESLLWSRYILKKYPGIIRGKTLYLVGGEPHTIPRKAIEHATVSKFLVNTAPSLFKRGISYPAGALDIRDYRLRMHTIAKYSIQENVTQLGFPFPLETIWLLKYIQEHREDLIAEIRADGKKLTAKRLEKLKDFKAKTIWPKLKYINCIDTVESEFHMEQLLKLVGKKLKVMDPGIYSTEGRITLDLLDQGIAGVMAANINFFEFEELVDDKFLPPVTIDKIKLGKTYRLLMTTAEGLYRYNMGDLLRVVGFKGKLPIVEFAGRNKYLNLAGEQFKPFAIIRACVDAIKKSGLDLQTFMLIPQEKKKGYELLIEAAKKETINASKGKKLASLLDLELAKQNKEYSKLRKQKKLIRPLITEIQKGSYDEFYKQRIQIGGETKAVHVSMENDIKNKFKIVRSY